MKYRIPVEISAGEDAIQKTIAASKAAFAAGFLKFSRAASYESTVPRK